MLCFWGQPRYSREPFAPFGYELFLREGEPDHWRVPTDFSQFTAQQIIDLLIRTAPQLPKSTPNLSINADIDQFVDPKFYLRFAQIKQQLPTVNLAVELTEHPAKHPIADTQLLAAARSFDQFGMRVILDDVGSGDNNLARIELMDPYVHEYKFAVQNFRPAQTLEAILPKLTYWHAMAKQHHKLLTIEGVESVADIAVLSHYQVEMLQGYFLGRPEYLPAEA
ncbi:EAL domain-containing protein [Loigolactobacillus jiayinensis]|uniref:EAL domain-containing protein n=1 Tax=Loigolactobacillus jiayinensis TaxID=2486016 RepID=A0ABW1RJ27_9LACO|nr:EAL domain-containing protein [Loigolactobacillus jiayinensis]